MIKCGYYPYKECKQDFETVLRAVYDNDDYYDMSFEQCLKDMEYVDEETGWCVFDDEK